MRPSGWRKSRPDDPRLKAHVGRSLSTEAVTRVFQQFAEAPVKPQIQLSLWSEPLMARNFREAALAAKAAGIKVTFNTNGLLLTADIARFLVDNQIDCVTVSVDAVTPATLQKVRGIDKLDKIHRAVDNVLTARGDLPLPRLGVSFTVHAANRHEHDAFLEYWVPRVDFVRVGEVFIDGGYPDLPTSGERHACPVIYQTLVVHANGNVSPCCHDSFGETVVGNVIEDGVLGAWHSERFARFRELHESGRAGEIPLCRNCSNWQGEEWTEEVRDGVLIRRSHATTYYNRTDRLATWKAPT